MAQMEALVKILFDSLATASKYPDNAEHLTQLPLSLR